MAPRGTPVKGVCYAYSQWLNTFEHSPNPRTSEPHNLILFVGGLFDSLFSVHYPAIIAQSLPPHWSIAQALLTSSGTGWGTSSLQNDVSELSECLTFFQNFKKGKIVLMGSSSGCQDVMEYLTGPGHETRAAVQGGILQAPVSDRESMLLWMDPEVYRTHCELAKNMVAVGHGKEIMPSSCAGGFFLCPVTANRYLSMASPDHDGDDDYFSTDLTDEQLMKSFGSLPETAPLCVLLSGQDEYMSKSIDKPAILTRWIDIVNKGKGRVDEKNSGVIEGASHDLKEDSDEIVADLIKRVLGFIKTLEN